MSVLNNQVMRPIYYMAVIAFHFVLFFTNTGNYFHGGKPAELIGLQVVAVIISVMAVRLFIKVKMAEKIFVVFSALLPIFFCGVLSLFVICTFSTVGLAESA